MKMRSTEQVTAGTTAKHKRIAASRDRSRSSSRSAQVSLGTSITKQASFPPPSAVGDASAPPWGFPVRHRRGGCVLDNHALDHLARRFVVVAPIQAEVLWLIRRRPGALDDEGLDRL